MTSTALTRRDFARGALAGLCGALIAPRLAGSSSQSRENRRPNVLLIAVDDLRTELGCYGSRLALTPNLDRFAQSGLLFERHYSHYAVCIPSRAAFLTSLRPERTHQVYGPTVWDRVPGVRSLGNVFRDAGYSTVSLGKVWHHIGEGKKPERFDVNKPETGGGYYSNPLNRSLFEAHVEARMNDRPAPVPDKAGLPPLMEIGEEADDAYIDGSLATEAIAQLARLKSGGEPFLLAVGFHKPHMPYAAPKRFWDLYDPETLPLSPRPEFPEGAPALAWSHNPNFHGYSYGELPPLPNGDLRTEVMPEKTARAIRHAYFACVSFVDSQIGRVLDALKREGLDQSTIVIFWADHGYHLGDLQQWGKQTNFETAVHTPLIVRVPGQSSANSRTRSIVESVDVLPTLLDLCGLAPLEVTDGRSFAPLVRRPEIGWKDAAFHVFDRSIPVPSGTGPDPGHQLVIGHALRTDAHRYIEWRTGWELTGELIATELYDYKGGPYEMRNLADDPAHADVRRALARRLHAGPDGGWPRTPVVG